ncbi:MAG: hypothetical protein Q9190_003048 [Brigantiaea leucoxantha]
MDRWKFIKVASKIFDILSEQQGRSLDSTPSLMRLSLVIVRLAYSTGLFFQIDAGHLPLRSYDITEELQHPDTPRNHSIVAESGTIDPVTNEKRKCCYCPIDNPQCKPTPRPRKKKINGHDINCHGSAVCDNSFRNKEFGGLREQAYRYIEDEHTWAAETGQEALHATVVVLASEATIGAITADHGHTSSLASGLPLPPTGIAGWP